jgi:hypothetical protein
LITSIDHLIVSVGSARECSRFVDQMQELGFGAGEKRVMGDWVDEQGRRVPIPCSDETVLFRSGAYIEFLYATGPGSPDAWFAERVPRIQGIVFNSTDFETDVKQLGLFERTFSATAPNAPLRAGSAGPEYYPTAAVYPVIAARSEPPYDFDSELPRLTRLACAGKEIEHWRETLGKWFGATRDDHSFHAAGDLELQFELSDTPGITISATFAISTPNAGAPPDAISLAAGSFSFVTAGR